MRRAGRALRVYGDARRPSFGTGTLCADLPKHLTLMNLYSGSRGGTRIISAREPCDRSRQSLASSLRCAMAASPGLRPTQIQRPRCFYSVWDRRSFVSGFLCFTSGSEIPEGKFRYLPDVTDADVRVHWPGEKNGNVHEHVQLAGCHRCGR